ncbi:MAG: phosphoribosylglycinamide formyltransferase [Deltaproteobacteria bacterium]|nr:phosphoribosylglycinamide formyltransferase [Deltaproteobacteria bacterium]
MLEKGTQEKLKIGVLVSGGGTNLQAILDATRNGSLPGEIVFVGSDNPDAYGLTRATKYGISTFNVDYDSLLKNFDKRLDARMIPPDWNREDVLKKQSLFSPETPREKVDAFFKSRAVAEAVLLDQMAPYPFEVLVLAGFMRILSPYFIDRINTDPEKPRIMNIHPSLLPAFPGTDGYGDTFRYGCKVAGCTVHFVDYGEDSGPIIAQRAFPIEETDTEADVRKKGLAVEWALYPYCITLFAQNRLRVVRKKHTRSDGKKMEKAVVQVLPSRK